MPTYIRLVKMTVQGAQGVKRFEDFLNEAQKVLEGLGGKIVQSWATLGRYDFVAVWEAPDDKAAMLASALIGARGIVAAETLPAITTQEFMKGLKK